MAAFASLMLADDVCRDNSPERDRQKSPRKKEKRRKKQHRKEDDGQNFTREGYAAKLCHIAL